MSYPPAVLAELASIGVLVGLVGTLVGVGGGFVVVPLLILGFGIPPSVAAGTSLVMVTVNALAGAVAYARQGRTDVRGAVFLTAVSYPGSVLGAWLGTRLPARPFSLAFGLLLIAMAAWMAWNALRRTGGRSPAEAAAAADAEGPASRRGSWRFRTTVRDEAGAPVEVSLSVPLAAAICFGTGFAGGMLGIGGGPLLVPALVYVLGYPVHIATATSQMVIALTSAAAALVHLSAGEVLVRRAAALSLGALVGAPLGAALSRRLRARQLVLALAAMLLFLGARLVAAQALGR